MRYLSVCSGIEAATVAWHPLGWQPVAFSEIEGFPSAVLAHHYGSNMPGEPLTRNGVPNLGDLTKFKDWPDYAIDLLVGGTPCQAFSIAGLREGLADPRGNLALTFLAAVDRYKPRVIVWENVPGVLSSNGGRDFASFLGGLGQLGYGWCYRVLDAQFCRVDGFPRAVPQRRRRVFVVGYLGDWRRAAAVLFEPESVLGNSPPRRQAGETVAADVVSSLAASGRGVERSGGTRGQDPVIEVAVANCLSAHNGQRNEISDMLNGHICPVQVAPMLNAHSHAVQQCLAVRRLMPVECERLQGFPDGYTNVPYRNKPASDGPRYKALGNSMAVNVMRWIGRRIEMVEEIAAELETEK
jgi:DNA (cytosine-5)-methyltransferase 1